MTLIFSKYLSTALITISLATLVLFSEPCYSQQQSDNQLALSYYRNKEFDKAAELYLKLYQETGFKNHRDYYIRSLNELREFETAKNFLLEELRRNQNDFHMRIDLGNVYLSLGEVNKADKFFNEALEIATSSRNNIVAAANSFQRYRHFKWAEKVYVKGSERTRENFDYQLGNIYFLQRNYEKMINAYISELKRNPQRLNIIQNRLQHILSRDIDQSFDSIVERALMRSVQQNPQKSVLAELLIWQYTQTGKFRAALSQLIAIDRRENKNGRDVYEFGKILSQNDEYELAKEAFQYLIDKGESHPIFSAAYIEYLNTTFKKNTRIISPDIEKMKALESELIKALEVVRRREAFNVVYALARTQAFYLQKYDEAIMLLEDEIENRRLNSVNQSRAKLLLGDIYTLIDQPWEATLIFAQVANENPDNATGHEARYKRAKLAYYTGEFDWAQAQLSVLKGGTSQLIANDALALSVFISDNYNLDTTEVPMKLFARADFLKFTKQYNEALSLLDSIRNNFPSHHLEDNILYRKAIIYESVNEYEKASKLYYQIVENHYYEILADNALYRYAILQEKKRNFHIAEEAYFRLLSEFPASIFGAEARNKLRELNRQGLIN